MSSYRLFDQKPVRSHQSAHRATPEIRHLVFFTNFGQVFIKKEGKFN